MNNRFCVFLIVIVAMCVGLFVPCGAGAVEVADRAAVVDGGNAFAADLYAQLAKKEGNLFFSPASVSTALAMTYAGAREATAAEMAKVLHFTLPSEKLHPALGDVQRLFNAGSDSYKLSVANALWAQQGYAFRDDYLKLVKDNYDAGLENLDFIKNAEASRVTINDWVAGKTKDKIKDLIPAGMLTAATRLVLTNAVYFKGDWESAFDKKLTRDEDFHASGGRTIKVPMMTFGWDGPDNMPYYDGGTFHMLAVPYKSRDLWMIVLLPKDVDGIAGFESSFTMANLGEWLGKLRTRKVEVHFPKFKVTDSFGLGDTLASMGMKKAFVFGEADFSGMTGNKELYISAVIHKAFVAVDEQGTEAAAATAVAVAQGLAPMPQTPPPVFRADHPFVFFIRDDRTGSILFMGRVMEPGKEG
jgi:serpin B